MGLRWRTPARWAAHALADPLALLDDHAHLERKAALNALALATRWPHATPAAGACSSRLAREGWAAALAQIAREETEHLALVLRLLGRRGARLSAQHANPYAAALHARVARGAGPAELADLLLVAALIEARSCERFGLLAARTRDPALMRLYRALAVAERRHGSAFLELARVLPLGEPLEARLSRWLDWEAEIAASQPPGPRMHSGPPPARPRA